MEYLNKKTLLTELENAFSDIVKWLNEQPEEQFNQIIIPDKWTMAGHLYHLIKSTRAVNKGLEMSKSTILAMFGKNNREERSYQATLDRYNDALAKGLKAPSIFAAATGRVFDKTELIQRFTGELEQLNSHLEKWDEKSLSDYLLPHPEIGKLTIREMMYFTTFHTIHHLQTLKDNYVMK